MILSECFTIAPNSSDTGIFGGDKIIKLNKDCLLAKSPSLQSTRLRCGEITDVFLFAKF